MSCLDQKHHIVTLYVCGGGVGEWGDGGEGERVEG